jgi:hypothetical protein
VLPSLWMKAELVVGESLRCMRQGKLYVIPGWRYRTIVALISKLPTPLRLVLENVGRGPGIAGDHLSSSGCVVCLAVRRRCASSATGYPSLSESCSNSELTIGGLESWPAQV